MGIFTYCICVDITEDSEVVFGLYRIFTIIRYMMRKAFVCG